MKTNKFLLLAAFSLLLSCSEDEKGKTSINPEDVNALIAALKVQGTNKNGDAPQPTFTQAAPTITNSQSSASITSNNNLYVPFTVSSTDGFSGIYLQVENELNELADSYWQIPLSGNAGDGQIVLPVGIPANVEPGIFVIYYSLYTSGGDVSEIASLEVEIVESQNSCEDGSVMESGSDGLTIRSYSFDRNGTISLTYDMYDAPDRMDIFVNQNWVAGTGSSLSSGTTPPASECYDGANGFVSGVNTIDFEYTKGKRVDIYMSGCFGGTAWDYWFDCPGEE
ncbi:MAG TPA: hypothetical protein VD884_04205 [Ohtaekwangia sp.]|nr:hypothetical protein [Ohtaekwangia sp.]